MSFWRNKLFCDEVSFQLPRGRQVIKGQKKKRCNESKNVVKSYKHGGGNLMFWGCVGWKSKWRKVCSDIKITYAL